MKLRLILVILIIIILVSINWFREAIAQDTDLWSLAQKQMLFRRPPDQLPASSELQLYQGPSIFGGDVQRDTAGSLWREHNSSPEWKAASCDSADPGVSDSQADLEGRMPQFSRLRPFGTELFHAAPDFAPPDDIAATSDYVLGSGDNLIIYLWGRVDREYRVTIDREGKVFIPRIGEIIGWGLTLDQFAERARKQFSQAYSEFELAVSLGKIRSMRIYVTGEVKRPGAYSVSSLTSVFNAIYLAGGPNDRGSMRRIRLMRRGRAAAEVDLYDLMLQGENVTDLRLETGDVVFIPVAGPVVAIRGEIRRPALYELKGGETARDLLELAGGATPEAHLDRVMLKRISCDGEWEVVDLNLSPDRPAASAAVTLKDGDHLTVYSMFESMTDMVGIFGKVKHPGYYECSDTTYLADLIGQGQLQDYDVYHQRADLFRHYSDYRVEVVPISLGQVLAGEFDMVLKDRDSLHIYAFDEIERDHRVFIEGEVEKPGRYPLYDRMTVDDLIFLAGSFTPGAYRMRAEIARLDSLGGVSLLFADLDDSSGGKTILTEDDHVYIRRIPQWRLDRSVAINGEVLYPGKYTLSSSEETLFDLLQRAGGFTENAFPKGIVFERESIETQLTRQRVPELLERSRPLVEDSLGHVNPREVFQYDFRQMSRVIIDIDKMLSTGGQQGDVVLEPEDRIYVPSVPSGISVMGTVGANGTIKYVPGKNVKYYIERAGNFTRGSDKKQVRLMRAGGEVVSGRGTLDTEVELGDIVIVPAKIEKRRDWLKTITTAVSATTGVLTSIYVVSKL